MATMANNKRITAVNAREAGRDRGGIDRRLKGRRAFHRAEFWFSALPCLPLHSPSKTGVNALMARGERDAGCPRFARAPGCAARAAATMVEATAVADRNLASGSRRPLRERRPCQFGPAERAFRS